MHFHSSNLSLSFPKAIGRSELSSIPLPIAIFIMSFFTYAFFVNAFYECNLRSYLMSPSFEPPVEDEHDIIAQGKKLYLPANTHYPDFFKNSPLEVQRK